MFALINNVQLIGVNRLLHNNQSSMVLLASYAGKSFIIHCGLMSFSGQIDIDGLLIQASDNQYSAVITFPLALMTYTITRDANSIKPHIIIVGDQEFAYALLRILSNLEFSGIYHNQSPIILFILMQIKQVMVAMKDNAQLMLSNFSHSVAEYLLYEKEYVVTRNELNSFNQAVDEINQRVTKLSNALNVLMQKQQD